MEEWDDVQAKRGPSVETEDKGRYYRIRDQTKSVVHIGDRR